MPIKGTSYLAFTVHKEGEQGTIPGLRNSSLPTLISYSLPAKRQYDEYCTHYELQE